MKKLKKVNAVDVYVDESYIVGLVVHIMDSCLVPNRIERYDVKNCLSVHTVYTRNTVFSDELPTGEASFHSLENIVDIVHIKHNTGKFDDDFPNHIVSPPYHIHKVYENGDNLSVNDAINSFEILNLSPLLPSAGTKDTPIVFAMNHVRESTNNQCNRHYSDANFPIDIPSDIINTFSFSSSKKPVWLTPNRFPHKIYTHEYTPHMAYSNHTSSMAYFVHNMENK